MNVRVDLDLRNDEIDSEVLRELFARISNWMIYHEWHLAFYDTIKRRCSKLVFGMERLCREVMYLINGILSTPTY